MIWILIAMSSGYYNQGSLSSVEFNNQASCIAARQEMKAQKWDSVSEFICVQKGESAK